MPSNPPVRALDNDMGRLEALISRIESLHDTGAQSLAREIVELVLRFHASGLAQIVRYLAQAGPAGRELLDALAGDELTSSLLVLHDLHPEDVQSRVLRALEQVRPLLGQHGGNVTFIDMTPTGTIRLRLEGNCHGCASSQLTLRGAIEQAIYAAAPDIAGLEVEGLVAEQAPAAGFVTLNALAAQRPASRESESSVAKGGVL